VQTRASDLFAGGQTLSVPCRISLSILLEHFYRHELPLEESQPNQVDTPQSVASTPPSNRQAGEARSGRHISHQTSRNITEDNGHEDDNENPSPPVDRSENRTFTQVLAGLDPDSSTLGDSWEPPSGTRRSRRHCIRLQVSSQLALDDEENDDSFIPIFAAACISDPPATDGNSDPKSYKAAIESPHYDE